jgi:hypothetical protein
MKGFLLLFAVVLVLFAAMPAVQADDACVPVETVEVCAPADACCGPCGPGPIAKIAATTARLPITVATAPVRAIRTRCAARCAACPCDPVAVEACVPVETVEVCAPADDCCRRGPGPIVTIVAAVVKLPVKVATAPGRAIAARRAACATCGACDPVAVCAPCE